MRTNVYIQYPSTYISPLALRVGELAEVIDAGNEKVPWQVLRRLAAGEKVVIEIKEGTE